jgi:urea transport system ATP-binding protein
MGLLRPRAGRITVGSVDLTGAPPYARARAGVGFVPQGRGIFPYLSVLENLQVAAEALRGRQPSLEAALDVFPALRPILGKPAGALSGGQQQQLAFARALIGHPRLLLLDEPTEGIQPSIIVEIEETLCRIRDARQTAVLLVEQYLEFALRLADRACVMENGRIVVEGPPSALDRAVLRDHLAV